MSHLEWILFVVVLAVCGLPLAWRKIAWNKRRRAFIQRLYQLTPFDKPLFVYNLLQGRFFAITTFDKLTTRDSERLEVVTPGGDKVLVNRTASISLVGDGQSQDEIFEYLIGCVMGCERGDLAWSRGEEEVWDMTRSRLFRLSDDLYIQIGTKVPPGTSRTEIERMNTNCYAPCEVWETLKDDIIQTTQSRDRDWETLKATIQSRTQVG
jgi:hypothetical protein